MNRPTSRIVGPKPRTSVQKRRAPAVGRRGVDDDVLLGEFVGQVRRVDERRHLGLELVDLLGLAAGRRVVAGFLRSPSIVWSCEEISWTLPALHLLDEERL
jgi:hypothetical protein